MEKVYDIIGNELFKDIFWSVIAIIAGVLVYNLFIKSSISKLEKRTCSKKKKTYIKMLNSISRYILILIIAFVILRIFNVNVTSIVAGIGVIGIIISFAVQDELKDIIKGMDILYDNYYQVGDVIKLNDITGEVLSVGLKTTKIHDVYTKNIISVSNRNVGQVEVVSDLININIPVPYEIAVNEAEIAMEDIVNNLKEHKDINDAVYTGIEDFADSSVKYQVKVYCNPILKVQTRRDALRCIITTLDKHGIHIPYNQLDIHQK